MATSDQELIEEVRSFTGYTDQDFSDSQMQSLVEIAKEELQSDMGQDSSLSFYSGSHDLDRALFWFTCIATKVRAGEIGSIDLTIDDLEARDSDDEYQFWFEMFAKRRRLATSEFTGGGASTSQIERTDRSYSYNRP